MKLLCATLLLATIIGAFSGCTDQANFYDADGDGCSYYATNRNACYTAARNRQGVSPLTACCACGGGTQTSTTTSAPSSTSSASTSTTTSASRCTDVAGFYDSDGDTCSYYSYYPSTCSNALPNRQGVSPRTACCACGGGRRY